MAQQYAVKVLDQNQVALPPGSVSTTTIPLTFLDVGWLFCHPMQGILFYEFPYPTIHFTQNIFPRLKHSLSLTLQHFFPFAANLTCPPPPNKPYILYTEGDSIPLTVTESDTDFNYLIANHARDNLAFKSLVPTLPMTSISSDKTHVVPIMAIQITVFPNSGISIGTTFNHVATDGKGYSHFMKSWASIHRSESGNSTLLSLPCHNKDVIKDPDGLLSIYLNDLWNGEISPSEYADPVDDVRVTLVLNRTQITKLKHLVTTQMRNDTEAEAAVPLRISTFVVTCAFMWVNLIKLQECSETSTGQLHDDTFYHLVPADCRERFEFPVPATYFGNCLALVFLSAKRSELTGKNGILFAAKGIERKIRELEKGPLIGADKWQSNLHKALKTGRVVSVASSPKLRLYDTDFGWGRPNKSEIVHIGANVSYTLAECRDEEGAIEIGLVISRDKVDFFDVIFNQGLNLDF